MLGKKTSPLMVESPWPSALFTGPLWCITLAKAAIQLYIIPSGSVWTVRSEINLICNLNSLFKSAHFPILLHN